MWADGTLKQTRKMGAGVELGTQGSVRMGVRKNDKRYFKGRISQLQIYNEALSEEQIIKIATKPEGERNAVKARLTSRYNQWPVARSMVSCDHWSRSTEISIEVLRSLAIAMLRDSWARWTIIIHVLINILL